MNCEIKEYETPIKLDDGSQIEYEMEFLDNNIPIIYVVFDYNDSSFGFAYYVSKGILHAVPTEFFDKCVDEFFKWAEENGYEIGKDEIDDEN